LIFAAELCHRVGERADAIVAVDQERRLGLRELDLRALRGGGERGPVRRHEVHLGLAGARERVEREQVDAGRLQDPQQARPLARLVGRRRVAVAHPADRVGHRRLRV